MALTYGMRAFRKIQIGKEATRGTAVPATAKLIGTLGMKETPTIVRPEEDRGSLSKNYRSTLSSVLAEMAFEGDATFEQILYFLLMGVTNGIGIHPESAQYYESTGPVWTSYLTEVTDDDLATHMPADGMTATVDYIYIGLANPFHLIRVTMGTAKNAIASVLSAEYSKGASVFGALTINDDTKVAGVTLAKSGGITFSPPSDWAVDTVNGIADKYWVRLKVSVTLSATVDVAEIDLIKGVAGVQQGATAAYLWTFSPNYTESNHQAGFTIEFGDNVDCWEAEFSLVKQLELSGAMREVVKLSADMFGRQLTETTFTGAITDPTELESIVAKPKFYLDDTGAGIGGTEKSAQLIDFTWRLPTGLVPIFAATGELCFATVSEQKRAAELEMTYAFSSDGIKTEYAKVRAQTKRFIRLSFEGTLIEGAYNKKLVLDGCFQYDDWDKLGEKDGMDIVAVKLVSVYDPDWTKEFEVAVTNKVVTLP